MHSLKISPTPWKTTATAAPRVDWKTQRERVDLTTVVTNELGACLKRESHRLLWRCPFHDDHDPSFIVYPDRNT
jgi:DNA primase